MSEADVSDDLSTMSASRTAALVGAGEISPVETVEAAIVRISEGDGSINAVVHDAFDEARGAAAALERRIQRGEPVGPLAGVPSLIKD